MFADFDLDGCSTEDKDTCTMQARGENDFYECFCKTDYCNAAPRGPVGAALGLSTLLGVVLAATNIS